MILRYIYRSSKVGTSKCWYAAEMEDVMKIFKYDDVMWMLVQRLDTGEMRWWNGHKWTKSSKFCEDYVKQFDRQLAIKYK